jgi:hypothetical protein
MYMPVIETFRIHAVDTKKLQFTIIDPGFQCLDNLPVLVIIKPGHPGWEKQDGSTAVAKYQQLHIALKVVAEPPVVFSVHFAGFT